MSSTPAGFRSLPLLGASCPVVCRTPVWIAEGFISKIQPFHHPGGFLRRVLVRVVQEGQPPVRRLDNVRVGRRVNLEDFVQVFSFWHE